MLAFKKELMNRQNKFKENLLLVIQEQEEFLINLKKKALLPHLTLIIHQMQEWCLSQKKNMKVCLEQINK